MPNRKAPIGLPPKTLRLLTIGAGLALALNIAGWFGLPLWARLVNLLVIMPAVVLLTVIAFMKANQNPRGK